MSSAGEPSRAGRWWLWGAAGVGTTAAALLWVLLAGGAPDQRRLSLPPLPDLSGYPPRLIQHLSAADAAARADPRAVGMLGMAYHADNFYDEAARCYRIAAWQEPREWRWDYYAALVYEELGVPARTVEHLAEVVRREPLVPLAWYRLAEAHLKQGRPDDAERAFRRALECAAGSAGGDGPGDGAGEASLGSKTPPLSAYATWGLARVLADRGDLQPSRTLLEELTAAVSGFGAAERLLAQVYRDLGHEQEADERRARAFHCPAFSPPADPLMDELARLSASGTFLLKQMGLARQRGNRAWAEFLARRALEVDPDDPDVVARLAILLLEYGRPGDAQPHIETYRRLVPGDHRTLTKLGYGLTLNDRAEEGLGLIEEALRQDNDSVDAWIYLGLAKAKLGKLDEAEAHARKALTLEPDHTLGRRFLITFLKDQGKIDAAIEQCEELLRLQKESAVAHCQLGLFLTHKGRLEEARGHLQRAIQLRPDYAEAYYNLCAVCTKEGDRRGARRNLELAIRAKPDYAEALNSLGVLVYGETGNLDEAERYARRALEADPAYFQAHENLGIVLEKRGRWEEAIQHYNLALKGHESSPRTLTLLAWILATCPEDSLRNGRFAVNLAEKACDATGRRDSKPLDVLAAACAEVGDFDRAAHAARAALSALPADPRQLEARDAIEARLELYLERRPYRQPRP